MKSIRFAAAFAVALASTAFAAGPFEKIDSDGDGKLSPAEHATGAQTMFEAMDANKDGKVTADEMTAAHEKVAVKKATKTELTAAQKIKVIDLDNDGALSSAEHANGSATMFSKMDSDKDGFISKAEMAAGHAAMMKK